MEISYGLVNLMYFMLSGELNRIKDLDPTKEENF